MMTLTIELSPEVEQQLTATAAANGLALPDYITTVLQREAQEAAENLTDVLRAKERLAEPGELTPWEQLKAEAGLV